MKKSELTQLTRIIEHLVTREIKKQLPNAIAEVFQNMSKSAVKEEQQPIREQVEIPSEEAPPEFKASLKELFEGVTPVTRMHLEGGPSVKPPMKQYTKNPILNQILNETTPDLRARERMTGLAAFQGGYNPGMPSSMPGETMSPSEEPKFAKNMPIMAPSVAPVLREGQVSDHVPMATLPEGVSALDVAKAGMVPPAVSEALTNYDRMKKVLNQSKGKR